MIQLARFWQPLVFLLLGLAWLASFRMADALTFFKTYSSIWFLPTGVTMAIVMVAPGWLKLAPLLANLLLALPAVRAVVGVAVVNDYEPVLHGARLYLIYGGAGLVLVKLFKIDLPATSLRDYQLITAVTIAATTLATVSGIGLHLLAGNMSLLEARNIAWSWWLGDAIGAFAVPPLLVPVLVGFFRFPGAEWHWPSLRSWLEQAGLVLVIVLASALVERVSGGTFDFWFLLIVLPVIFALRGGLPMSATCVFLTVASVPTIAVTFSLQLQLGELAPLLLATTIVGLLLGAALSDQQSVLSRLEHLVEARTEELREAHEFQRHLIRSIGHDLRQPIDGMNMVLEGLERLDQNPANSQAIRQARQIGALASQLLSTILTYARFDAGRVLVQAAPFPVARLFLNMAELFEPFAELKHVRLVWHHHNETLVSDERLVGQALSNLLDNAIRLSEPGSSVIISTEPSGETVAITVSDSVSSTTHRPGAAGFGLDIVGKIAKTLGGTFTSASNARSIVLPHANAPLCQG